MRKLATAGLVTLPLLLAGCSSAVTYVSATDPVLMVCQAPDVQNIGNLQKAVDNANNTSGGINDGHGRAMTSSQVSDLQQAVRTYRAYAGQVAGHPVFADDLRNAAQEFAAAASSPTGLTTNTVAVAVNMYSHRITATCGAFRVGIAPRAAKPGPGLWDWNLFGIVLSGYLAMIALSSYVIAVAQRSRPRKKRLGPGGIFWWSLIWWVSIFAALARTWGHLISSATLTKDEKKDDRIAAQQKEVARLQREVDKGREEA